MKWLGELARDGRVKRAAFGVIAALLGAAATLLGLDVPAGAATLDADVLRLFGS